MPCGQGEDRPCYRLSCLRHMWWWWFCEQGRRGKQGSKFAKMTDGEIIEFVEALPITCETDLIRQKTPYYNAGCTLKTIADATGVTRERVRQVEEKALKNLELKFRRAFIEDFQGQHFGLEADPLYTMYPDSF